MRADGGLAVGLRRAMHRDVFTKNIMVANAQTRRLVLVFQVLRRVADDATRVKFVV